MFGAFFGIGVSIIYTQKRTTASQNIGDNYFNNLIAMIGTIFLWMYLNTN